MAKSDETAAPNEPKQAPGGVDTSNEALKMRVTQLEGDVVRLEGEVAAARASEAAAKAALEALQEGTQAEKKPILGDLGKDSFELLDSVTIPQRDTPSNVSAVRGQVVSLLKDIKPLQEKLGTRAKVYAITRVVLDELIQLGFVRE